MGYPIPSFDFAFEGVTSISADIHKYGYAAKGASVVLYREAALRRLQFYVYTPWSGGIYASPSMTGTRPGGAIAAAWTALRFIGRKGYQAKAKVAIETALAIREGIEGIEGVDIIGQPDMTIFALYSTTLDIYELGDEMATRGWFIDRQQLPPSLHFTITPVHADLVPDLLEDLRASAKKASAWDWRKLSKNVQLKALRGLKRVVPSKQMEQAQSWMAKKAPLGGTRSAAMYGMMGELQDGGNLEETVTIFLDRLLE